MILCCASARSRAFLGGSALLTPWIDSPDRAVLTPSQSVSRKAAAWDEEGSFLLAAGALW